MSLLFSVLLLKCEAKVCASLTTNKFPFSTIESSLTVVKRLKANYYYENLFKL